MRAAGQPTPQVTFLAHAGARGVTDALWRDLYGPGRHADLWFRWRGKPLLLAPTSHGRRARQVNGFSRRG
jgi:hypothetical protein